MADDSGPDATLFPQSPAPPAGGYLVLARKYRPRTFEDMIGQEAMVRTIANSFALGRAPHAYMLTGVRGVGKTTTARLLARALNYKSATVDRASIALDPPGEHCQAIMESRHPDVFEMDAASRTGINDIREILDSVRYAPVLARCKVYIIDEVHMLSAAAFNGLLKTLEEPPAHVKFIFATTEIRKVPVTVLSRCQRFDLKRIQPQALAAHLAALCARENVAVEPDGLALIARAGEGSVRDALSLLDQAIVQTRGGAAVSAADVREMLGLADRSRMLALFAAIAGGETKAALLEVRGQYEGGADPALILRDLLEIGHEAARAQALGADARLIGGAEWTEGVRALGASVSPGALSRLWQMLLKALEDVARAPDPLAAVEMAIVRLCAAAGLPPPEEAARLLRQEPGETPAANRTQTAAPEPAGLPGPRIAALEDVTALIAANRNVDLEIEVERHVRPIEVAMGKLVFALTPDAPPDLTRRLARALEEWTGLPWAMVAQASLDDAPPPETLAERRRRAAAEALDRIRRHPFVADALKAFPGAEIVDVRSPESGPAGGEIIAFTPPARRRMDG